MRKRSHILPLYYRTLCTMILCKNQISKGCLQKKNSIWRDILPTSYYPLTPFKSRDKNRRDIFWVLDPLPPFKSREICKLWYQPRNYLQRNFFQSYTLYLIKTSNNGIQVKKNVKIGKIWVGSGGNCSTDFQTYKPILTEKVEMK